MKYTTIPALFVTFSLFFFSISTVHAATLLDVDFENRSVGSYAENDIRTDFQVNMLGYNDPNWLVEFMDIAADPASSGRGNVLSVKRLAGHGWAGPTHGGMEFRADFEAHEDVYFAFDMYLAPDHEFMQVQKNLGFTMGPHSNQHPDYVTYPTPETLERFVHVVSSDGQSAWSRGDGSLNTYYYDKERISGVEFWNTEDPTFNMSDWSPDWSDTSLHSENQYHQPAGRWISVMTRIKMNTVTQEGVSGLKDGLQEAWVADPALWSGWKKVSSHPHKWRISSTFVPDGIIMATGYGGNGDLPENRPSKDQYHYYDNFVVSTQPIPVPDGTTGGSTGGTTPPPPTQPGICHQFTSSTGSTGNGLPYAIYGDKSLLLKAYCRNVSTLDITVGKDGDRNSYVYNKGFILENGNLQNITYACSGYLLYNTWCIGEATKTLTNLNLTTPTFFAAYTCEWYNDRWYCGCQDAACTDRQWQMQMAQMTSSDTGGGTTGGDTGTTGGGGVTFPTNTGTLPTTITNGSHISLDCGTTYYGTLDLSGKSNVTVDTSGTCGSAVITPLKPVSGFTRYSGEIYVADVSYAVGQVVVDGAYIDEAHYPNSITEDGWIVPANVSGTNLSGVSLPNSDVVGARFTYRSWGWQLGVRTVTAYNGDTLTVTGSDKTIPGNYASDAPLSEAKFYLQGKLWMLDQPGEWVYDNGKLYVWIPGGGNPGSRVRGAPSDQKVVNVSHSNNVTLDNLHIVGGHTGIEGNGADWPQILNSKLSYSEWYAVNVGGVHDGLIDGTHVYKALRTGITGGWGGSSRMKVTNSTITDSNMVGMHKSSSGGMMFYNWSDVEILNNTIVNSGMGAIWLGKSEHSLVENNLIDGACLIHSDCGGFYAFHRECEGPNDTRVNCPSLGITLRNNTFKNVNGEIVGRHPEWGPMRFAVYLDDSANGVTVTGNTIEDSYQGIHIHGGFDNVITGNTFSGNDESHVIVTDFGTPPAANNVFSNNTFYGPTKILIRDGQSDTSQFVTFLNNTNVGY